MAGTSHKQQLDDFIKSLHDQGILDHHFDSVRDLQNEENPRFVLDVVTVFLNDADNIMAELGKLISESILDSEKIIGFVHQIRGSASSIGGCRMALACRDMRHACDDKTEERCIEAFGRLKEEYNTLRANFNIILELERNRLPNKGKRRRPQR